MGRDRRVWFHWQNLNEKRDGSKGWGIVSGRAWLHLWTWAFHWEWHLWSKACHIGADFGGKCGEEFVLLSFALPPVSLYFGVEPPCDSWVWHLAPASPREVRLAIHDWCLWINPWSRQHEWNRKDPWWVRGLVIHVDDLIWGKTKHVCTEPRPQEPVEIELDGRIYRGTARFERRVWKRPRWFAMQRDATWIDMDPKDGLPHAGKGENGWDCGDDALCGWGVDGFDKIKAIASGIEKVMKYRQRYGNASGVAA